LFALGLGDLGPPRGFPELISFSLM
jgi:hypothetical protein